MIRDFSVGLSIRQLLGGAKVRKRAFSEFNLPKGKLGKIVRFAIWLQDKFEIEAAIQTKVSIGRRDKEIELCFVKRDRIHICYLLSPKRADSQILDALEILEGIPSDIKSKYECRLVIIGERDDHKELSSYFIDTAKQQGIQVFTPDSFYVNLKQWLNS